MAILPPPPVQDQQGSFAWLEWYRQLRNYISTSGSVPWYLINFSGSTITDIADRSHQNLQALQGGTTGERYHLTAAQHAALSAGDHYGTVRDTTTQTMAAINTAQTVTYNSSESNSGVELGTPNSRIVVANSGRYQLEFSTQITSTSSSTKQLYFWYRKNGVDAANSTRHITLTGNNEFRVLSVTYSVSLAANDYIELCWASDSTAVSLTPTAASAFYPAGSSIKVTLNQINQ